VTLKRTPIDPDSFAWKDICDIYGNPYRIGDQFRVASFGMDMPHFDAELGPSTLLYFEVPPDDETETDYISGRPRDPDEIGGWTHYKLRELTEHRGTRATPAEVLRMIDEGEEANGEPLDWSAKARALVAELTGPDGGWTDAG
jgi:hypothetical protein